MALVEIQPRAQGRARQGPKKVASLAPDGGGRVATPAARGAPGGLSRAVTKSIWGPIVLRALGVLLGMLALAAIGASSIARGSGVRALAPSAHPAPRLAAAGVAPFAQAADAGVAPVGDGGAEAGAPASQGMTPDGRVILNRASADDLRHLPGVGPKRADAIVALRQKLGGRFKRLSDLLRVKGIGPKSLKKMEGHVVLDASAP